MDDDGALLAAVAVDIAQVKLRRQAEVQLAGGERVLGADGRLDVDVQLRAVEGGLADLLGEVDAELGQHLAQRALGVIPHGVVLVVLLLVGRIAQRQHAAVVGDAEVAIDVEDQIADRGDLVLDLLRRTEQVRVVLAEVAAALDALEGAGGLIAEVVRDLADAQGQLAVGTRTVGKDAHVVRAVHRAQDIGLALQLHGREHVVLIVIPVAGGLVELDRADAGREHVLVALGALLALDIGLELLPDRVAVGQEHRQAAADEIVGHEQLHFLADLAVVALARLGLLLLPLGQLFGRAEGHAVDAGEHLVLAVVLPIGAGLLRDLEGLERLGVGQVGSEAHVDILALLVEAELALLSQVVHVLELVLLAALFHQLFRILAVQDEGLDRQVFLDDLLHFLFDRLEILRRELRLAEVHVIVKAVLGGGAVGEIRLREQALDRLGHDVRRRVADNVQFFLLRTLVHMAVLVNDLHTLFPPKMKSAPTALSQNSAKGAFEKARFHLELFTHFRRLTRAAREGIFSPRLGSGDLSFVRKPLSAWAALSVTARCGKTFSVKAFQQ